jgi:hypothetical protein
MLLENKQQFKFGVVMKGSCLFAKKTEEINLQKTVHRNTME